MDHSSKWQINTHEYHPYFKIYIQLLDDTPILEILENQLKSFGTLTDALTEEKGLYRYAEGKWSVKEVIGHIIDTERIFACRAVAFARNDRTNLPGFEQDDYVREAGFDKRTIRNLHDEFHSLRKANLAFFTTLSAEELLRKGTANKTVFTVRTVPYILAGHFLHHFNILSEKYL